MSIKYKDGYRYVLAETYSVQTEIKPETEIGIDSILSLTTDGLLTIGKGYAWDGPSGPSLHTLDFMRGSMIHDALYQLMRADLLSRSWFDQANRELQKACLEDGMFAFRAWYVYKGVSLFGRVFTKPGAEPATITAP